jgi:tetratricopeptide (TPR) repeat protein
MPYLSHDRIRLLTLRRRMSFLLFAVVLGNAGRSPAQNPDYRLRIAQLSQAIHSAEFRQLPPEEQGKRWAEIGIAYWNVIDFGKAEDAYLKALRLMKNVPSAHAQYAATSEDLASLYLAFGRTSDAESAAKQAFSIRQKLGDPTQIALSKVHMADIDLVRHQFKQAEKLSEEGMRTLLSAPDAPKTAILSGWISLTYARCSDRRCGEGLKNAQQAMAFATANFPPDSAPIGFALETLGFAEWKSGARQEGEKAMQEAVRVLRQTLAPADPRLAGVLLQYRAYLVELDRTMEARDIERQVRTITRGTGSACSNCEVSVNTLANGLR